MALSHRKGGDVALQLEDGFRKSRELVDCLLDQPHKCISILFY